MIPRIPLLGLAALAILGACDDRTAGGSTDTETGALAGTAVLLGGQPAGRALVELHSGDSLATRQGPVPTVRTTVADSAGRWNLGNVPPGTWNLVFTEPGGKRAFLAGRVVRGSERDTSTAILHSPGSVRLKLASSFRGKVWIEGTDLAVDPERGDSVLAAVPAGYAFRVRAAGYVSSTLSLRPTQDTTLVLP